MTIKEVEERTGLARSNIRFYEKEKLIAPARNAQNGYRDYSQRDVENIRKIAYLRTLEIPVEDIRRVMSGEHSLLEILERQEEALQRRIEGLSRAKALCRRMIEAGNVSFDELQIETYVVDLPRYWRDNRTVFKLDTVSFLRAWGGFVTWAVIVSLCLVAGAAAYPRLPRQIPVQWSRGVATSLVDKRFIFAYPVACIVIRALLRPVLYGKLAARGAAWEIVAEYLTNTLCFMALSLEAFSILFICDLAKSVVTVLLVDTVVLIGILISGMARIGCLKSFRASNHLGEERR